MLGRFAPVLLTALILSSGCSAGHYGVEPTDLSVIQIGATRSQVNEALGPPVERQALNGEQVSIYEYNKGRPQRWATGGYGFAGPAFPIVLIGQAVADRDFVAEQRGRLFVAFGPDDRITSVETQEERQSRQQREQRAFITRLELEKAAAKEDFAAVYGFVDIGSGLQEEERTRWTCIAAHHEYAPAQKRMGVLFWHGIGGLPAALPRGPAGRASPAVTAGRGTWLVRLDANALT